MRDISEHPQLPAHLVELARQHGIDLNDLPAELSDADLEAVVGGKPPFGYGAYPVYSGFGGYGGGYGGYGGYRGGYSGYRGGGYGGHHHGGHHGHR